MRSPAPTQVGCALGAACALSSLGGKGNGRGATCASCELPSSEEPAAIFTTLILVEMTLEIWKWPFSWTFHFQKIGWTSFSAASWKRRKPAFPHVRHFHP
jgi:hypothetical protein